MGWDGAMGWGAIAIVYRIIRIGIEHSGKSPAWCRRREVQARSRVIDVSSARGSLVKYIIIDKLATRNFC
jgi:hypothetical protein